MDIDVDEEGSARLRRRAGPRSGSPLLQLGRADDAVEILARPYAGAPEDGPAMSIGCRLALAYAAAHRADDAERVDRRAEQRTGGTFSDRILTLWADSLVRTQLGDARRVRARSTPPTTSRWHRRAARARDRRAGASEGAPRARHRRRRRGRDEAAQPARRARLTAEGWSRVFDLALAEVSVPS